MQKLLMLSLLLAVGLLAACSGAPTAAPVAGEPPAVVDKTGADGQPYPMATVTPHPPTSTLAYPGPGVKETSAPEMSELIIPEPGANSGVVYGKVVDSISGKPFAFYTLYLGFKIFVTPGPGYSYGIKENESPHVLAGPDGSFVFPDVPPGRYLLIVYHPKAVSVVMEPNSDLELEVVVEAGQTVDLGSLEAPEPHAPPAANN